MQWLEPEVVMPATFAPLDDLATVRAHLNLDTTSFDTILSAYVVAACAHVSALTGLTLSTSTLALRTYALDCAMFRLPAAPIQSVTSITYSDANGTSQTVDPSLYVASLSGISPTLALAYGASWPVHRCGLGAVTITAVCGWGAADLPTPIQQAILLLVGDWFANRETVASGIVSAIPMHAVDALLANWRRQYL